YVHFLWGTGIAAGLLAGVVFVRQPLSAMSDVHATCEYEARRAANLAGEFEKYLDRMAAKCEVVNDCLAGRLSLDQASVKLEEIYADEPQHLRDFAVFQHSARS